MYDEMPESRETMQDYSHTPTVPVGLWAATPALTASPRSFVQCLFVNPSQWASRQRVLGSEY
ncbi:hypothetical protein J6590_018822 [Homalodisca vitripennis]|nr:hypothetical protein J6590_018822 [Homalodisca vitripennis]